MKKGQVTVRHIPEGLCQPLSHLLKERNILEIKAEITGEPRSAAGRTLVPGGGIEIPCSYRLFRLNEKKRLVRSVIKEQIRKLSA